MTDASIPSIPKQLAVFKQLADCGTAFSRQVLSMVMGMLAAVLGHTFTTTAEKQDAIAKACDDIRNTFKTMCIRRLAEAKELHMDVRHQATTEYNLMIEVLDRIRARQIAEIESSRNNCYAEAERARASAISSFMAVPENDRFVIAEKAYSGEVEKYKRMYADGCARAELERVTGAAGYETAYMSKLASAERILADMISDIMNVRVVLCVGLDALCVGLDALCVGLDALCA